MKQKLFWLLAGTIVLFAFGVRLIAAEGDLWLDEIWTLKLVKPLTSADQVFWKINHDNNHYLNSLWMYALGPFRPSLLYRAPVVLSGTLAVMAVGWWARRRGRVAAIVAMLLFAGSYLMVDLTSQARGYGGLILAIVLMLIFVEDALNGKPAEIRLGLVALFGILSNLLMVIAMATVFCWVYIVTLRRDGRIVKAGWFALRLFLPACVLVLPIVGCLAFAIASHAFVMGAPQPYDPKELPVFFGRAIEAGIAVPGVDRTLFYAVFAALAGAAYYRFATRADDRRSLYVIAIAGFPLLLFFAQMPNSGQPRHFLISAIGLMFLLSDLAGHEWRTGFIARRIGMLAMIAVFLTGNALLLAKFLRDGRGHYADAMKTIAANGPALYAGEDGKRNPVVEQYYIDEFKLPLSYVPFSQWCATPPRWLLLYRHDHLPPAPELTLGPSACAGTFDAPLLFPSWGLSGTGWIVYRRAS